MRAELWVIVGAMSAFAAILCYIFVCVRPSNKEN